MLGLTVGGGGGRRGRGAKEELNWQFTGPGCVLPNWTRDMKSLKAPCRVDEWAEQEEKEGEERRRRGSRKTRG